MSIDAGLGGLVAFLSSDEGRTGRKGFWWFCAGALAFAILLLVLVGPRRMIVAHTIFGIVMIFPCYCVFARRLQDMAIPGAWAIVMVAITAIDLVLGLTGVGARPGWPARLAKVWMQVSNVNLVVVIALLGIWPGTPGQNRYGLQPEA